jgi:hypothetical protein
MVTTSPQRIISAASSALGLAAAISRHAAPSWAATLPSIRYRTGPPPSPHPC